MTRERAEALARALEQQAEGLELQALGLRRQAAETRTAAEERPDTAVDSRVRLSTAAARSGLSVRQLRAAIKIGKLPGERVGRDYLVRPDDVVKLIEANRVQPRVESTSDAETTLDETKARAEANRLLEAGRLHVVKRG